MKVTMLAMLDRYVDMLAPRPGPRDFPCFAESLDESRVAHSDSHSQTFDHPDTAGQLIYRFLET